MPILPDQRREEFCQFRAQGKSRDESYRQAGYRPNRQNAQRLTTKDDIKARIAELQAELKASYECTVETMAREFDNVAAKALEWKQPGAAAAALNSKAKLFGLMTDRSVVSVTHNYALMSEEELRFEIAAIHAEARAIKAGIRH